MRRSCDSLTTLMASIVCLPERPTFEGDGNEDQALDAQQGFKTFTAAA